MNSLIEFKMGKNLSAAFLPPLDPETIQPSPEYKELPETIFVDQ
jgi:hypothetical protein